MVQRCDTEGNLFETQFFAYPSGAGRLRQTVSFPNEHFAGCGEVACVKGWRVVDNNPFSPADVNDQ